MSTWQDAEQFLMGLGKYLEKGTACDVLLRTRVYCKAHLGYMPRIVLREAPEGWPSPQEVIVMILNAYGKGCLTISWRGYTVILSDA